MKRAYFLLCVVLFVQSALAAPLVFKTTKAISSPVELVELFTLDTSKYHDLRLHVASSGDGEGFLIVVYAVEGDDVLRLFHDSGDSWVNSLMLLPPAKIRVAVRGKGTFKAFVWAQ